MDKLQKQQGNLRQSLTLVSAVILVISSVIGSGVYKKVAPMSAELLSPSLVLACWLIAGIISLFGALSNAEIAGMLADAGGEYAYFKRIYGKFMAFLYGWSVFAVIKSATVASIAYVFSHSLNSLEPLPHLSETWESINVLGAFTPFDNFGVKLLTIFVIIALTFLNSRGLKGGAIFSTWITWLVLAGLAIIIITGLYAGGGSFANIAGNAGGYIPKNWYDFDLIKAFFGAMLAAFWAYEGWNSIGFLGAEVKNPKRNIPLALFGGISIVIIIYLLVNFTYLYVLPIDRMVEVFNSQNEVAAIAVIGSFAGIAGTTILTILIIITVLGCTNSTILMPPRIYYAMAKDKQFFPRAANIHPKYNTPVYALWIQAFWASLLVLSGSFDQLTDMLVFAAFFFYGATTLGVFIMRKKEPLLERPYKVWGYPVVPAFFLLFCAVLVVITFFTKPREAMLGLLLMLTGIPFYWYWNRKSKAK
ncbi:MAG: amino acid permease [Bacteroidales bacterium]|nr:amino acid permease [Bacteroidales bacterium]